MSTTSTVSNQMTIEQIIERTKKGEKPRNTGELGKDDFLNLLVTQLRYQDPLQPMDDKEFIGQLAQFSALEQMQNLNSSFSAVKAFNLIGKRISANIAVETSGEIQIVEGYVSNIKISQGKAFVIVGDKDVPVDSITTVSEDYGAYQSNISAYTGLIGMKAEGAVYDLYTGEIVKVSGKVKALHRGFYEDYAVMDGVTVEIDGIVTDTPSAEPGFVMDYLEAHNGGGEVEVVIVDRNTGSKVPVKAKLREYSEEEGIITAVLDDLRVPLDGIVMISTSGE